MASEKPTMILKSKTDIPIDDIDKLSDSEAWKIIYSIRKAKEKDDRLQVCFTGFGPTKKAELKLIAEENKFKVVGSITKSLDFLVAGDNAGPVKIRKAESQGVQFLSEEQFINLVETGEVPE